MEIAVERFGDGYRKLGIRTWLRRYPTAGYREIELRLWDRVLPLSIRLQNHGHLELLTGCPSRVVEDLPKYSFAFGGTVGSARISSRVCSGGFELLSLLIGHISLYDVGIATLYCSLRAIANTRTDVVDESGNLHVLTGSVVGKLPADVDMTSLLNRYRISHPYLPRNVFSLGFNVANLESSLDALLVKTKKGVRTLAELERDA